MLNVDIVVIGGGPAGLAAAVGARQAGAESILILERDNCLGGILNQCIHNGFGLHRFRQELTGPEYAQRYIDQVEQLEIPYKLDTMVLDITPDRRITAVNPTDGVLEIQAKAVVLAMGCRERSRGAIGLQGTRCAGVYTAGAAQKYVNIAGYLPGKEIVILGSGDIGLIMARRMTLEGAKVRAVVELMPYSGGLKRNIVQCLDDFDIPLLFSHTVVAVHGKERVESVDIAQVDDKLKPIAGTTQNIPCDTVLLSVGLLPENELSQSVGVALSPKTGGPLVGDRFQTSQEGFFACGNVLHVHDLVDYVSEESYAAGTSAARYAKGESLPSQTIEVVAGDGISYTVPATVSQDQSGDPTTLRFRVNGVYTGHRLAVYCDDVLVHSAKKRILLPGEMETLPLRPQWLADYPGCRQITIRLEEDQKL